MTIPDFNFVQAVGMLSFVLGVLCFYQHDDRRLKILMIIMNLNNVLHFALLGAVTASLSAMFAVVRTGIALRTSSRIVAFVFIAVAFIWGAILSDTWYDMFPVLGTCIGTYAVFCLTGITMRIGFLCGAVCWLTNNIIVGSIGTTLMEATLIMVNLTTIYRIVRMRRQARLEDVK